MNYSCGTEPIESMSPVERLHFLIRDGRSNDLVKTMINEGVVNPMDEVQTNFTSPLGTAIENNNQEMVDFLVAHPDCDVNVGNRRGRPAVYIAANKGYAPIVRALLERGANMELRGLNGDSALLAAVRGGFQDVIKLLVDSGCDLNAKDNASASALHLAALNGHENIVHYLLEKGCDPNAVSFIRPIKGKKVDPNLGIRPLHYAAHTGNAHIARLLVTHGANVDAKTYGYRTPLHTAATWDSPEVVDVLVEARCDVNAQSQEGDQRKTALGMAVDGGHEMVVEKLLQAGASVSLGDPLLTAIYQGNKHIVLSLLRAGADVNQSTCNGTTTFQLSLQHLPSLPLLLMLSGYRVTAEDKLALQNTLSRPVIAAVNCGLLVDFVKGVHPLKYMCRSVIRHEMGTSVRTGIQCLPLPNPLRGFIGLFDIEP